MRDPSQRILLIDPEDTSAHAVASALERRGLRVRAARDLERGFELEPHPRVVVAELASLEGRAAALLAESRLRRGTPALLVLLARPDPAELRRALRLGAADVLCKPFDVGELAAAIDELARRETHTAPDPGSEPARLLRRTYPAQPASVERAARDLSAFALLGRVGPACRARLASACAEVLHNACYHAYAQPGGSVELDASLDQHDVVVTIRDRGEGFDASIALADAFELGFERGLGRAAALCEGLDIHSTPGQGARVVLRFGWRLAAFDGPDELDLSERDFLLPDATRVLLRRIQTGGEGLVLSPALAVLAGRLLAGPDPRRALALALWS